MNVCQACGSEGYLKLLIRCAQCQIAAIHRYCVDGPTSIDNDEVSWSCEDCVPRVLEPAQAFRKSEHIYSRVDREVLRRNARKKWGNHLSMSKVKKSNCVGNRATKVADDATNLDEKIKQLSKIRQGKLKGSGTASKMAGSELATLSRQKKKVMNPNGAKKKCSESSLLTGQKIKDLNSLCVDAEDIQTESEKNSPQLSEEPEHSLERTTQADEINNKYSEIHSSILEEQQGIESSQSAKRLNDAGDKASDNIEETKTSSASHQRGDKQSGYNICKFQTRRKKRRLVVVMEYTDSDEEPDYVRDENSKIIPDVEGRFINMHGDPYEKKGDRVLAQRYVMKSDDHFPTWPSSIKSDYQMLPPKSSIDFENRVPPLSNETFDNHVSAQPVMNAVWRGYCNISDNLLSMSFGLEAHLSNKANYKVFGAVSALPISLNFEIVQKHCTWPKSFEKSPPTTTSDSIGLYFFPVDEGDEKSYDVILDEMIERELVLKSHINSLELWVFCSQELPKEERRFRSKYYLWGFFRQKQEMSLTRGLPMYH